MDRNGRKMNTVTKWNIIEIQLFYGLLIYHNII